MSSEEKLENSKISTYNVVYEADISNFILYITCITPDHTAH